jgi:hypothetical protein
MTHTKFGTKYTCFSCAAKYYDMRKPDPKCPKCGKDPREDPSLKAHEKGAKRGAKEDPELADAEDETFEADMDDLVNDEEGDAEEEGEVDELGGGADEET